MARDLLNDAIYDTVHDYRPDGARGLAPRIGMNAGTLQNKANPAMEDYQLTLAQSIPLQLYLRDFRILHAYSHLLDHAVVPLGDYSDCSDTGLLDLYAAYHAEIGETAEAVRAALAGEGGRITRRLVRTVRRELIEDMQAGMEVLARLQALVEGTDDD